jgi:hypothetical protein
MYDFDGRQIEHWGSGPGTLELELELDEVQELELAAELLEVVSEEGLAKWVGGIDRAVAGAQRRIGKTYTANQGAVDKTLRVVKLVGMPVRFVSGVLSGLPPDVALGQANQVPEQIDRIRSQIDPHLRRWAQRELEARFGEDSEFELACRYTRFAHRAMQNAWRVPRGMAPTQAAAASIRHAARRDLPGLVPYLPQLLTVEANGSSSAGTGRWHRQRDTIVVDLGEPANDYEVGGAAFEDRELPAATKARDLIFFGYSGASEPTGAKERDGSFSWVAQTLKLHLQRRFPNDDVQLVCAWHKDVFVRTLLTQPPDRDLKIRQIHYVGHGGGGGLFFGYLNAVSLANRNGTADLLARIPLPDQAKRRMALFAETGLISGFFSETLAPDKLKEIKAQLAPGALMHVWGCFAGAPTHRFDTTDPYWARFNAGRASVDGIALDVAKTLGIETTACWEPEDIHGMDFCFRTDKGAISCANARPGRLPHWLWPRSPKVRWITYDATGSGNEKSINFLGTRVPAARIAPGRPPKWFTNEIPTAVAKKKPSAFPTCSAAPVGF